MVSTLNEIEHVCLRLRQVHRSTVAAMTQAEVLGLLMVWAERWCDPLSAWRQAAGTLTEPFPFVMTRVSLDALLDSLDERVVWELIDAEGVRNLRGVPLLGHVIAGNTPLLAWTSLLRALLMRSASLVKLPSRGEGGWVRLFVDSLSEISPALASCIHLACWRGGTVEMDAALCRNVDKLLVYGSASTIQAFQALCTPSVEVLGYGHRVSFGLLLSGTSLPEAARGFARDVLIYDQGGCLSPHTIFVEGAWSAAVEFAEALALALRETARCLSLSPHFPDIASHIHEARTLARMESNSRLWEDEHLRWTVIARSASLFTVSPTHGVISVQPIAHPAALEYAVGPVAGHLQGCAISEGRGREERTTWCEGVAGLGVSWICQPGQMQAPPFSWREDERDVLRSLLPTLTVLPR